MCSSVFFLILQLLLCRHHPPLNADLTAYYDVSENKWYVRNPDGTKGSEIQMGSRQKNYVCANGTSGTVTIDISDLDDSTTITFGVFGIGSNSSSRSETDTVSTIKTWTTAHKIIGQTSPEAAWNITYLDGKMVLTQANSQVLFAYPITVTIND